MCHKSWEPPIYETSVETGAHEGEHEGVGYGRVGWIKASVVSQRPEE